MAENKIRDDCSRKSFRYPGSSEIGVQVMINKKAYDLFDIGSNGAGVLTVEIDELGNIGEKIIVFMHCGDKVIEIDCSIVHISKERGGYRCGLEFSALDADIESRLFECMRINRENYFSGF